MAEGDLQPQKAGAPAEGKEKDFPPELPEGTKSFNFNLLRPILNF